MKDHFIPFVSKHRKLLASILWLGAMVVLLLVTIFSGRGDAGESDRIYGSTTSYKIEDLEKNYQASLDKGYISQSQYDRICSILQGLSSDGEVSVAVLEDILASVAAEEDITFDSQDRLSQIASSLFETKSGTANNGPTDEMTVPEPTTQEPTTEESTPEPTTQEPTTEPPKAIGPNGEWLTRIVAIYTGPRVYVGDVSLASDIQLQGELEDGQRIVLPEWECAEIGKVFEAGSNLFYIRYQGLDTVLDIVAADPRESVMNGFNNLGVVIAKNYLNVRNAPSTKTGKIVGKLYKFSGVDLLEPSADGQWFHIISNEVDGWINAEYVAIGEEAKRLAIENCFPGIKVTAKTLNVRSGPSTKHDIITQISKGSVFVVSGFEGEWIKIDLGSEDEGYVHSDYTDWFYMLPEAVEYTEPEMNPIRKQLIDFAMEYLGGTYKYGGTKLGVAVDCSGFTMRVFEHFGYELSRTAAYQMKNNGVPVDYKDMKPGDLIFFWSAKRNCVGHVGIYIGNGKMIHAASEKRGIVIDRYDYMTPIGARNVIGE
ncbi:MAG: SH3 domain-containing protein [Lachnospiraceae bacterium]|nr:SH3 domain-containing protein [Lachnospiraceae bacterium]